MWIQLRKRFSRINYKNLKEIMNLDVNDIILLKNEFIKKLSKFMDIKKY